MVAVADAAAATVLGACEIFRAPQTGERRDELECRAGRQTADRAVDQWIALVFLQRRPILRLDAGDESIWIERRHRSHRENVAVVWIDDDCARPAYGAQRFFGDQLECARRSSEKRWLPVAADLRARRRRSCLSHYVASNEHPVSRADTRP